MHRLINNPSTGSDPEVFVVDTFSGDFISVIGKLGGTKTNPIPMPREGFFAQEDNVAAEFNIPPARTRDEFIDYILYGLQGIRSMLPEFHNIRIQSSAFFPPEQLEDPRSMMFGCSRDRNAWTRSWNAPPKPPMDGLRTTGGHITIGYDNPKKRINERLIRAMDFYLGVPSVLMDQDKHRRKLYGKAGAYRDKDFGVEYRTLSSFWLADASTIGWAYDQTHRAINHVNSLDGEDHLDSLQEDIMNIIDNSDVDNAKNLIDKYELVTV